MERIVIKTPDDLYDLKAKVTRELNDKLRMTKTSYESEYGFTDKELYTYNDMLMEVNSGTRYKIQAHEVNPKDLQEVLDHTEPVKMVGATLYNFGSTTPIGRIDYYQYSEMYWKYYVPLNEITEAMIQAETKNRLTAIVMPEGYDEYSFYLDCKLLEQFKIGNMSMDDVIDYSKGDCEL